MKLYKYLIIIILLNLFLFSLSSNEKPIIENDNIEETLNDGIDSQFCFSFKTDKFINSNKNSLMAREDYLKRAGGFLAIGVIGVIVTSLSPFASAGLTIVLWDIIPILPYLFIIGPILFWLPFIAIGIPFLITGFINYRFYIKQKIPDPFINENKNNEIVILKFNFEN